MLEIIIVIGPTHDSQINAIFPIIFGPKSSRVLFGMILETMLESHTTFPEARHLKNALHKYNI